MSAALAHFPHIQGCSSGGGVKKRAKEETDYYKAFPRNLCTSCRQQGAVIFKLQIVHAFLYREGYPKIKYLTHFLLFSAFVQQILYSRVKKSPFLEETLKIKENSKNPTFPEKNPVNLAKLISCALFLKYVLLHVLISTKLWIFFTPMLTYYLIQKFLLEGTFLYFFALKYKIHNTMAEKKEK